MHCEWEILRQAKSINAHQSIVFNHSLAGSPSPELYCRVGIRRFSLDFVDLDVYLGAFRLILYIPATEGSAVGQKGSGFSNREHDGCIELTIVLSIICK